MDAARPIKFKAKMIKSIRKKKIIRKKNLIISYLFIKKRIFNIII